MKRSTCTNVVGFSSKAYKRLDRIAAALEAIRPASPLSIDKLRWFAHDALRVAGQRTQRPLADECFEIYVEEVAKAIRDVCLSELFGQVIQIPPGS